MPNTDLLRNPVSALRQLWRAATSGQVPQGKLRTADPEVLQARTAVLVNGLPEAVAVAAERRREIDWRPLAAALDTLYVARGGTLGVRMFLTSPQRALRGAVPADLIARDGELERVARAAYSESARADLSRIG
jgi:Protein of unknown function (DUF2384)